MGFQNSRPSQVCRPAREPTAVHVEVDTFSQAHQLSDLEAYGSTRKPSSDFLSFNEDEEQKRPRVF
ncbi:hypothetical protein PAXINDRAFT_99986 [Paxillus involutus ATCC 200175]|nr:hypothetical protein PAXINDRAFT_99986 [Paxillus involutus ATCC 200175]